MAEQRRRPRIADTWRDHVRDSEIPSGAKLVAYCLSTYVGPDGRAWPSRRTLAQGCSVSLPTIDKALRALEIAGFLVVEDPREYFSHKHQDDPVLRRRGGAGRSNRYLVALPEGESTLALSVAEESTSDDEEESTFAPKGKAAFHEPGMEPVKNRAGAAGNGRAPALDEDCTRCGTRPSFDDGTEILCLACLSKKAAPGSSSRARAREGASK